MTGMLDFINIISDTYGDSPTVTFVNYDNVII